MYKYTYAPDWMMPRDSATSINFWGDLSLDLSFCPRYDDRPLLTPGHALALQKAVDAHKDGDVIALIDPMLPDVILSDYLTREVSAGAVSYCSAAPTAFFAGVVGDKLRNFANYYVDLYKSDNIDGLKTGDDVLNKALKEYGGQFPVVFLPAYDVFDQPDAPLETAQYVPPQVPQAKQPMGTGAQIENKNAQQIITYVGKAAIDEERNRQTMLENQRIIRKWLPHVKEPSNEEIVIVSAGPSVDAGTLHEIKTRFYDCGVKIVAMKHVLQRLIKAGIKPWGCVLLDARDHMLDYVKVPCATEINWFASSMCNTTAIKWLLDHHCPVYGYHHANMAMPSGVMPSHHFGVQGASAAALMAINLMDVLGYKTMHLYGYDLCYYERPNMVLKADDGQDKYHERTITAKTWGGGYVSRTFWSEPQLLVQAQEWIDYFAKQSHLRYYVHGDGIIAFLARHKNLLDAYEQHVRDATLNRLTRTDDFQKWLDSQTS